MGAKSPGIADSAAYPLTRRWLDNRSGAAQWPDDAEDARWVGRGSEQRRGGSLFRGSPLVGDARRDEPLSDGRAGWADGNSVIVTSRSWAWGDVQGRTSRASSGGRSGEGERAV